LKKLVFYCALVVFTLSLNQKIYAQDQEFGTDVEGNLDPVGSRYEVTKNKLFASYSYGAVASWLTRIIDQSERSNFVFRDFLPGAYFGAELRNVKYITPMARLTVYYPMTSSFNKVPQYPSNPLHYGIDLLTGFHFGFNIKDIVRLHAGPALHMFFLNAERWNYFNLGAAAVVGVEVPLTPRWTLLVDGIASFDSGNLGANRKMEPFDTAFQYQAGIGCRYSKKHQNEKPFFIKRNRSEKINKKIKENTNEKINAKINEDTNESIEDTNESINENINAKINEDTNEGINEDTEDTNEDTNENIMFFR
jgi:hypothetical protein